MNEQLAALIAETNKKHPGSLFKASELSRSPRLPSGSLSLDMAMGGGWPTNVWAEIAGRESSGKTSIAHKTVAACQAADPAFTVLWAAAEAYDEVWAKTLGVDTDRVTLHHSQAMEEVYDLMAAATASKAFNLIVLDSYPALSPDEEAAKAMNEPTVAIGAKLTAKFFRKASINRANDSSERPMLGIIINQYRQKIGGWAPNGQIPKTRPGGDAKDYAYSVRLEVARSEYIDEERPGRGKARVGQTMKVTTAKNKTFAPGKVASVDFYFDDTETLGFSAGEYDYAKELMMHGVLTEAITRAGAYYTLGATRVKGREGVLELLRGDLTAQEELAAEIRARTLRTGR